MGELYDIWNWDEPLVRREYEKSNYKIIETSADNNECVVYFSSNNIWYPNDKEVFRRTIIQEDRYEWRGRAYRIGKKNIYLRDIAKCWYACGVNSQMSSVDLLADWLREQTAGYEVVCIGSSAGGYIAALMGNLLKAKLVFCFSAQFNLYEGLGVATCPILYLCREDESKNKYYDISPIVNASEVPTLYVYPQSSECDVVQSGFVKSSQNFKKIAIRSDRHGVPIRKCALEALLRMNFEEIRRLSEREVYGNLAFSLRTAGLKKVVAFYLEKFVKKVKR